MTQQSLEQLIDSLNKLVEDWLAKIKATDDLSALEALRVEAMGKKGALSQAMRGLGALSHEERQEAGKALNGLKAQLSTALDEQFEGLKAAALENKLRQETMDVSLPPALPVIGKRHPITTVIEEIVTIFERMGFSVAEGSDIDDDYHNFTALNFPAHHPARQMHDTFYLTDPATGQANEDRILRTHTSTGQVRTMEAQSPPFRVIVPGRTFRSDSDITHTPMFHQVEGMVIDKKTHFGHLKGCLRDFCADFFEIAEVPLKFRPSYFPFTEPSAEVDIGYRREGNNLVFGGTDSWMEILGCGMTHPNVLRMSGIDPDEYQGFAFGMGVERLAMLKYGIGDLRTFFDGDQRWLDHYGFSSLTTSSGITGVLRKLNAVRQKQGEPS